jgi:hypothetical protein
MEICITIPKNFFKTVNINHINYDIINYYQFNVNFRGRLISNPVCLIDNWIDIRLYNIKDYLWFLTTYPNEIYFYYISN